MRPCRTFRRILVTAVLVLASTLWCTEEVAWGQGGREANFQYGPAESLSQILGRPTGDSVMLASKPISCHANKAHLHVHLLR